MPKYKIAYKCKSLNETIELFSVYSEFEIEEAVERLNRSGNITFFKIEIDENTKRR